MVKKLLCEVHTHTTIEHAQLSLRGRSLGGDSVNGELKVRMNAKEVFVKMASKVQKVERRKEEVSQYTQNSFLVS